MGSNEKLRIRPKYLKNNLVPKNPEQLSEFVRTTDLLIATPLKLVNAIAQGDIGIKSIGHLVIDEADKFFEMELIGQLDKIITYLNEQCDDKHSIQKTIFSATMQPNIEELVRTILVEPVKVLVGIKNSAIDSVDQKLIYVGNEQGKLLALREKFKEGFQPPMLVFVQSKHRAKELHRELIYDNVKVDILHAGMPIKARDEKIANIRSGKVWVLVCSDLISRGIDFKGVNCIVNYDFPQSIVSYIHRVGRTGRAGQKGTAITFVTNDDIEMLKPIANVMKKSVG